MQALKSIVVFALLLLSGGCVPSLHPTFTEADIVFDPRLIGHWTEDDPDELWTFSREGTNHYKLTTTDEEGKPGSFQAYLFEVSGSLFLDFFPDMTELKENDFFQLHLVRAHTLVHVKQVEPTLQLSPPEPDWLETHLKDHPDAVRHEKVNGMIVLTASPRDLQTFWSRHLQTKGAFSEPTNMKKRR